MAIVVGIDEVGYGPWLGPFVVAGVAFETPSPELDLRRAIRDRRVRDSKKVFTQEKGIASLEPIALSYLSALWTPRTHAELWERLSSDPRRAPWYGDLDLPPAAPPKLPEGVRVAGAWARILDAAEYNRRVGSNKSDLNFECASDLMDRALRAFPGRIDFHVGRQGGRQYYLRPLTMKFGTVMIREESPRRSVYETPRGTITFLTDGEDRHFLIALASIIGKYVRELSMRLFNEYWTSRIEGLRGTAGYGRDARRFWREIEPHLDAARLTKTEVLRIR